jgi:hypothetical protein
MSSPLAAEISKMVIVSDVIERWEGMCLDDGTGQVN